MEDDDDTRQGSNHMALKFPSNLCFFCPSFVNLCSERLAEVLSFLVVNTAAQLETPVPPDRGRLPIPQGRAAGGRMASAGGPLAWEASAQAAH